MKLNKKGKLVPVKYTSKKMEMKHEKKESKKTKKVERMKGNKS